MVEYLSGGRIQGSSAALATPTYSGDLGTWAATGSQVTESSDVVSFAITTRIANHTITNDLGSALSDSEWVLRCKLIFTTLTPGGNSTCFLEIGMSDTNHSAAPDNDGNTLDYMGLQLRLAATNGTSYKAWGLVGYNSSGVVDNPESPVLDTAPTTQTYYVEIKRLSTTSMSIGLYDSDSFDSLIMPVETKTGISSGVSGLRYLRVGNALVDSESSTGNVITGTVRDFQIWNGAAISDEKATITNIPAGTRYEETNTRKIFRRKDATSSIVGVATPSGLGDKCWDMTDMTVFRTAGQLWNDGNFSFSVWYYPTVTLNAEMAFTKHWNAGTSNTGDMYQFIFATGESNHVWAFIRSGSSGSRKFVSNTGELDENKWNLITFTYNTNDTGHIYINGTDETNTGAQSGTDQGTPNGNDDWAIGASGQNAGGGHPTGAVEDVTGYVMEYTSWDVELSLANHVSMWNSYNNSTNVGGALANTIETNNIRAYYSGINGNSTPANEAGSGAGSNLNTTSNTNVTEAGTTAVAAGWTEKGTA